MKPTYSDSVTYSHDFLLQQLDRYRLQKFLTWPELAERVSKSCGVEVPEATLRLAVDRGTMLDITAEKIKRFLIGVKAIAA